VIAATIAALALGPQLTRLANGIPIIVEPENGPHVTIQVLVRTDDLTPEEHGVAETMAAALFGETENYSLRELQRLAWSIGGAVVAESAGDCLRMQVTTTPGRLRPTAAFISDALRRPAFTKEALSDARTTRDRYQAWLDRTPPLRDIRSHLEEKRIGPANISTITPDIALSLHARVVRPERVSIAVVGPVTTDSVASIFGSSLGLWSAQEAGGLRRAPAEKRTASGFKTAVATVKGPIPKADGFAAWVAACIAMGDGKGSALNRKFRMEQGAAYVLGSYFTFRHDASYCTFYVSTSGEPPAELREFVKATVPTEAEAARAKAFLAGRYQVGGPTEIGRLGAFSVGHETEAGRAFWLAWWELKGAGIGKDSKFSAEVDLLNHQQIAGAVSNWLVD
jgi:predicted Zn-dependent peptidase